MKSKLVFRTILMFFQHAVSCTNCQSHGFPATETEKNSILLFIFSGKIFSHRNLDCQEQLSGTDQIILSFRGGDEAKGLTRNAARCNLVQAIKSLNSRKTIFLVLHLLFSAAKIFFLQSSSSSSHFLDFDSFEEKC